MVGYRRSLGFSCHQMTSLILKCALYLPNSLTSRIVTPEVANLNVRDQKTFYSHIYTILGSFKCLKYLVPFQDKFNQHSYYKQYSGRKRRIYFNTCTFKFSLLHGVESDIIFDTQTTRWILTSQFILTHTIVNNVFFKS